MAHRIRRNKFLRRGSLFFFAMALSFFVVLPFLWDWVLVRDEVTLPRSGSVLGKWQPMKSSHKRTRGAKKLDNMNLKNWSNCCSLSYRSKESGVRVRTRTCLFSACGSSISETIIPVKDCSVVSSNSNFMDGCRTFTNSCKLDFCVQCLEVLLNFVQTTSSCGLFIPSVPLPKTLLLLVGLLSIWYYFIKLQTKLYSPACDCSVDIELDSKSQRRSTIEHWMPSFLEPFHHMVGCGLPFSCRKVALVSIPLLFTSKSK